jgi:hypothetical protein
LGLFQRYHLGFGFWEIVMGLLGLGGAIGGIGFIGWDWVYRLGGWRSGEAFGWEEVGVREGLFAECFAPTMHGICLVSMIVDCSGCIVVFAIALNNLE